MLSKRQSRQYNMPVFQEAVDPQTVRFNAELEKITLRLPSITETPITDLRAMRESGQGYMGLLVRLDEVAQNRVIKSLAGDILLRVFTPSEIKGVYLHFHDGGWSMGGAHHQDVMLWTLANECDVAVVSVEYRLAPENPFPDGAEDCEHAALWLLENCIGEFGTDRLLIGGESSGAHLAVSTLLWLRDHYGYSGFCGANLCYGIYDLTFTPSVRSAANGALTYDFDTIQLFCHYLLEKTRVEIEERGHPDISPLYANLQNLPPALFTVGTYDALLDDSLLMYDRWRAAGNQAGLATYPGAPHRFTLISHPLGRLARQTINQFLREQIN